MYICKFCLREFSRKEGLTQHSDFCRKNPFSKWSLEHTKKCPKCGKIFIGINKFCSSKCSHSRTVSEKQRSKTSQKLLRLKKKYCLDCGKELERRNKSGYCFICLKKHINISEETRLKLSNAGKKSSFIQRIKKRSYNEIMFSEIMKTKYNIICNEPMFNGWDADVILPEYKIAILWNGNWHYKNICNQLHMVENRDRIKYNEIIKCGYMPYIIVDLGKKSLLKCEKEFKKFNNFLNIIKSML